MANHKLGGFAAMRCEPSLDPPDEEDEEREQTRAENRAEKLIDEWEEGGRGGSWGW